MSILLSEQEQFRARIDAIAKCDKPTDEVIFKCQLEAQDAKSIAVRNKWWVKRIEDDFGQGILCGFWPKYCDNCTVADKCLMLKWQSLKQSLEVTNGK